MTDEDPPLVSLKVTNPVTYLKRWWKRVATNEGVDFRFRVRPLTAIAIAVAVTLVLTGTGFSLGRITFPIPSPIIKYVPQLGPSPTPDPWKETAFTGSLKFTSSTQKYYLVTTSAEAITLNVPSNIDLSKFVGKRILASGNYNKSTRILDVKDAQDLEVLPTKAMTIPTLTPAASPTPVLITTPEPTIFF
jgi:hypothetical protein